MWENVSLLPENAVFPIQIKESGWLRPRYVHLLSLANKGKGKDSTGFVGMTPNNAEPTRVCDSKSARNINRSVQIAIVFGHLSGVLRIVMSENVLPKSEQ